jgi:hypothetical protein
LGALLIVYFVLDEGKTSEEAVEIPIQAGLNSDELKEAAVPVCRTPVKLAERSAAGSLPTRRWMPTTKYSPTYRTRWPGVQRSEHTIPWVTYDGTPTGAVVVKNGESE